MAYKIILFIVLLLFFLVSVQGGTTTVKFETSPDDEIKAGETIGIAGSVSASNDIVCTVYGVIKHKKDSRWEDVSTLINDTIALSPGEAKNYKREWSAPGDAEPGEYGFYVRTAINGTRDSWSYPKFKVVAGEQKNDTPIPQESQEELAENSEENKTVNEMVPEGVITNDTNVRNDADRENDKETDRINADNSSIGNENDYETENTVENKSENESGLPSYASNEVSPAQKSWPLPFADISIILALFVAVILLAIYRDIF